MIHQFTDVVSPSKGNQDHDLVSYNIGLPQLQLMMSTHAQLSGTAERVLYWGGANQQVPETLTCRVLGEFAATEKNLQS